MVLGMGFGVGVGACGFGRGICMAGFPSFAEPRFFSAAVGFTSTIAGALQTSPVGFSSSVFPTIHGWFKASAAVGRFSGLYAKSLFTKFLACDDMPSQSALS